MTFIIDRRKFLLASGAAASGVILSPYVARAASHKIVIVGGGPGGATCARYLKLADPQLDVTLIEANPQHHTCFMSNEVLSGDRQVESLIVGYDGLKKLGINVVIDLASGVDVAGKSVSTASGKKFAYDRCVVAPGIDLIYGGVPGYSEADIEKAPHAWKAGPQTALLKKQLDAMPDGGNFVMVAPPNPYRCPPGPYERASLVAQYLKQNKPKSKVIILDPKEGFSKQGLFIQAWTQFYGYGTPDSIIEWVSGAKGGKVKKVDISTMSVECDFETYKAAVLNIIPPQKAGKIAVDAGLTEGNWVPVNKGSFESRKAPGVYVLGDASDAAAMPKSAYAANSQAKVTAVAIISSLKGVEPPAPTYINTCYSIAAKDHCFSIAGVYTYDKEKNAIVDVPGAGGLSKMDASAADRKRELAYAHSWYANIRADSWG